MVEQGVRSQRRRGRADPRRLFPVRPPQQTVLRAGAQPGLGVVYRVVEDVHAVRQNSTLSGAKKTVSKAPMSSAARPLHFATAADLRALGEERRFHEVIGGELVRKASPSGEHGAAQAAVTGSLFGPFNRGDEACGRTWRRGSGLIDTGTTAAGVWRWTRTRARW